MRFVVCTGLLVLSGCATVGVTKMKSAAAKPYDCEIEVVLSEGEAKKGFQTLCLLDAVPGAEGKSDTSLAATLDTLKPHACKCGADALILKDSGGSRVVARAVTWDK